jgi:glycerol-3-phosphate dehydrogenase
MSATGSAQYDLAVIGGGINGAGIARDAAGRGLKVLLLEKDDLAAHTSSQSTKLIHGGLRYLEHYEFRLVAEALAEREVLLRAAPHIVSPLQFVLPHEPHLRPAWMIRAGLFLYDHLGRRETLPSSFGVRLRDSAWGAALKPQFERGFVYWDAWVDDARLVVLNAIAARELGADIRTRAKLVGADREPGAWRIAYENSGAPAQAKARALINATGPWVKELLDGLARSEIDADVRHVKGSHIVVPRVHREKHAYILQNADQRVAFIIPYQDEFSLIGTTDVPVAAFEAPAISAEEIDYLCKIANAYLARPIAPGDVVWSYSGVRPLYDDGSTDPSEVTRDYVLELDHARGAPILSIFGGKITTYRRLAEAALAQLRPFFPGMKREWTHGEPLPGGDVPRGGLEAYAREIAARHPWLPEGVRSALIHRHGTRAMRVIGEARSVAELGRAFGDTLYAAEVDYLVAQEWACTAEDVLWRRTKCGLHLDAAARAGVAAYLEERQSR